MMRSSFLQPGVVALGLLASLAPVAAQADEAIFAGGCFWSMETDLDRVEGVTSTTSGYIGGTLANPTYQDVVTERTGHYEAVKVTFDPAVISYDQLLSAYWHSIDPTDAGGQFCDRGDSYRTAIFPMDETQRKAVKASKTAVAADLEQDVATKILPAATFYPGEDYHQDYARKNPDHYNRYRMGCGRDRAVRAVWGDKAQMGMKPAHS
ncbi:peptide-methionine (S)-S-oxide reductase MsrA [Aureimonas pseudogalii]|uniref:Peptide methionine sulfoxide reductase MsrA n=1 Tax=Aureimonas pseudogalii TaxID=1744844 RepID=A0A7W6H7C2_9HYPH|nr:peptide-methionine (S)-S-oxide reductase MsrA [Aureimonas pseudogalii]MBB3999919.1 peptide-methionine (S)-S-oxide reductase [Aureimonas pseudogalii]